eukprot:TRINITY_DN6690_c0_g1_i1.p1 TRINITY_DN6690_c0_g1~~TRINITY_DN6690_c0_g1_i1.p1  ORF type:complete len:387 (+),score=76.18 TRINITY_DN6690_c0_g1_i1:144-1304(+)
MTTTVTFGKKGEGLSNTTLAVGLMMLLLNIVILSLVKVEFQINAQRDLLQDNELDLEKTDDEQLNIELILQRALVERFDQDLMKEEKLPYHPTKQFLYLIQGAEIGQNEIQNKLAILPSEEADYMVLLFAENPALADPPVDKSVLKRTIYWPKSTWTTGRNQLFTEAARMEEAQGWMYKYWIFMDEDFGVHCKPEALVAFNITKSQRQCWTLYEHFLKDWEPAVSTIKLEYSPSNNEEAVSVYYFDAILNAFHAETRSLMFPYDSEFDPLSWYYSQVPIIHKSSLYFPNHVLQPPERMMSGGNGLHRAYPRNNQYEIINKKCLAEEIPEPLRVMFREKFEPFFNGGFLGTASKKTRRYDRICSYPDDTINTELMRLYEIEGLQHTE